jgi:putative ABC transport system permease protein
VNESLARRLFGDADPVGQRLTVRRASRQRSDFGQPVTGTVVGVVRDVRRLRFGIDPAAEIYVPYTLETWPWVSLLFRSDAASRTIPLAREAVRQVDAAIPEAVAAASFGGFALVDEFAAQLVAQRRLALTGIGAFSLVALVLAAIGLYAVISYGVAMRRREIGVRMALGATPSGILRLVLGEGLQLGVAGTVVGVAGAFFLMRLVQSLLYGTAPTDIASYALAAGTLLVTVLVACYLPARRAARVDPTQAVRASQ